jgi:hypothetical protein
MKNLRKEERKKQQQQKKTATSSSSTTTTTTANDMKCNKLQESKLMTYHKIPCHVNVLE